MPTVTIRGGDISNGNLTISPAATLQAGRGSIVNWIVTGNIGVTITKIEKYSTSTDIFSIDPHKIGNNNYQGTINPSVAVGTEETYYINWNDSTGNPHTFDPKINVNR